jgi:hypothetical protein
VIVRGTSMADTSVAGTSGNGPILADQADQAGAQT